MVGDINIFFLIAALIGLFLEISNRRKQKCMEYMIESFVEINNVLLNKYCKETNKNPIQVMKEISVQVKSNIIIKKGDNNRER